MSAHVVLSKTGFRAARRRAATSVGLLVALSATAAAQSMGTVTGRVTDASSGAPVPDAAVRVIGSITGVLTRNDGTYRLSLAPGRYEIRVSRIGYAAARDSVLVDAAVTVTKDFRLEQTGLSLDQIVVTGTRRPERTAVEAPVPVDVLSAEDLQNTGLTETSQVIQMLAPSFNFPRPSVNDGTDHVRPATLRGLGPDQVLVLVNGKRRHTTALVHVNGSVGRGSTSVDLNAIPVSAIERIEILRDGAAAQYGSDAIAGVINVVLRADANRSISASLGQTTEGDGRVSQVQANYGVGFANNGVLHFSAEFRDRDSTNRTRPDVTPQCTTGTPPNQYTVPGCVEGPRVSWSGDASTRDWGAFMNTALPFSNGMELYAFGGYSQREGIAAGFFRRAFDDRTVRAVYPNGFLPLISSDIADASLSAGVRGIVAGWSWDLGGVYGQNGFEFGVHNSINTSMGVNSPRDFYAGALRFNQMTFNGDITRQFGTMIGPVNLAVGAEFRRDNFKLERGDENSYRVGTFNILDGPNAGRPAAPFAQVFPGFRPEDETDASRNNVAGYIDLELSPTEALLIGIAGRAERYSDFGSTTDAKVAIRYELLPGLAARGAMQTGFRAPSLGQSYFSAVSTNFIIVNGISTPFEIRTFAVGSRGGELLGAVPLKPEESENLSAGITFNPVRFFSLTADWYRVNIDDRIVLSGNFVDTSVANLLARNGIPGVSGARYFTNAVNTRTTGLDIVTSFAVDLKTRGLVRFTAGYNENRTKVLHVDPTPPQLAAVSSALFDRTERSRLEEGQPRNRISLTSTYDLNRLGLMLHTSRYGKIVSRPSQTTAANDQVFQPKWITDMSVSYRITDQFSLALSGANIFDVYPDTNITPNQTRGIYLYSGLTPFGFNGAFWSLRATYEYSRLPFLNRRKEAARKSEE
ncbi:MAG TPA: TonB-dependent receptor [Gemmatimonadaceae bacterium]|nr:TonB-dependent receptor [Gemmatimonadaceae bacterium]